MSDLPTPEEPSCGLVTFHSVELVWENALEQANEIMAVRMADERVKVILQKQALGWSDSWEPAYTGYAGRHVIDNLAPLTEYKFRIKFVTSTDVHTEWSSETSVTTKREPLYAEHLHKAVLMQNVKRLKQILEQKEAPIDAMDKYGCSPLMLAAAEGYEEIVALLLEHGADVNFQNDLSKSALMMAAFAGRLSVVKLLRAHGASYQLQDKGGSTALHWACDSKSAEMVDWMLADGADVNVKDGNGYTPLLRVAALNGSKELINALLRHRANVNDVDSKNKTALMLAVVNGNAGIVQALLDGNADVSIKNKYGKTVYDMAVAMDRKSVIKCLEDHSVKSNGKLQ